MSTSKERKMDARRVKRLYRALTWEQDLEKAVQDLTNRSLRELNGYLGRKGAVSGIPSVIHGLVLYEMAMRLAKQKDNTEDPW